MGWRFSRRIRLLPGVRMNISKSGISWSFGPSGASISFGKRGTHTNLGIPGTGISYRQRIDEGQVGSHSHDLGPVSHTRPILARIAIWTCALLGVVGVFRGSEMGVLLCLAIGAVCWWFTRPRLRPPGGP